MVHEQSNTQIFAEPGRTVSRATLRPQDLIPSFLDVIRETPEYAAIKIPAHALEDETADYWESEDCSYLLNEELFDILNSYAPEGYYFGAHPGDGSDFAYWEVEE